MKTFIVVLSFLISSYGYAQQVITKKSVNSDPVSNDGVKVVFIQNELIPYNPHLHSKKNISFDLTSDNNTTPIYQVSETKNLISLQERNAIKIEKKIEVVTDPNLLTPVDQVNEVTLEPVLLLPYQTQNK